MFCTNCGKSVVEGAKFCAFCGEKIVNSEASFASKTYNFYGRTLSLTEKDIAEIQSRMKACSEIEEYRNVVAAYIIDNPSLEGLSDYVKEEIVDFLLKEWI